MKKELLFIFLLVVCCKSMIYANYEPLDIGLKKRYEINKHLYFYTDSSNSIDINKSILLQKNGSFLLKKSMTSRQEFGYNTAPQWLYFSLSASNQAKLMLELEYNNIDYLSLFQLENGKIIKIETTGDNFSFDKRPYLNNNYVFPINIEKGQKKDYFLYINQPNAILSFTINLYEKSYFIRQDNAEYLLWGIYIGIICIVLVVNLVLWLVISDKIYLWFLVYVFFMAMHLFADAGLAFQYLWPNNPTLNSYHPVYLYIWLGLAVQVIFLQKFIHQTANNSKVFSFLNWFRWLVFACFFGIVFLRYFEFGFAQKYLFKWVATISSIFVPIIFILTMISLYERRHDGEVLIKYYGWAISVQFFGYLFVAFVTFSQTANTGLLLPFDLLSYLIIGAILLLDIFFFSFGLAHRYKLALIKNQEESYIIITEKQLGQIKIIESLAEERRRLSQDLHDNIGATMAIAKGYISMIYKKNNHSRLLNIASELEEATNEIRNISHQLMPANFKKVPLANSIFESVNKLETVVKFDCHTYGSPIKLASQIELIIFSLANEIINDIPIKSSASNATIQLIYHPTLLNLSIEHNGNYLIDFNAENAQLMAEFIKAELLIDTHNNSFSFILKVPFV